MECIRVLFRSLVLLSSSADVSGVYNVATGVPRLIGAAIDQLRSMTTCDIAVEISHVATTASDVTTQSGDAGRLRAATGWSPSHPFEQSLRDLLDSWRAQVRKDS